MSQELTKVKQLMSAQANLVFRSQQKPVRRERRGPRGDSTGAESGEGGGWPGVRRCHCFRLVWRQYGCPGSCGAVGPVRSSTRTRVMFPIDYTNSTQEENTEQTALGRVAVSVVPREGNRRCGVTPVRTWHLKASSIHLTQSELHIYALSTISQPSKPIRPSTTGNW